MRIAQGQNLWNLHESGGWVVIPTNLGWKRNGDNVMGRGLALQAKAKFPNLPSEYGMFCRWRSEEVSRTGLLCIDRGRKLILAPTKPLRVDSPWLSWQGKSSKALVVRSLEELKGWFANNRCNLGLPLLGTGNGCLNREEIRDLIMRMFAGPEYDIITLYM